ncbi:dihydropteroate synthase [Cellulomonas alba]|uniref:Dihydropteroate synthase n=1 Tax=Cellulomonas alba TaxID=3053467 RepID=A0ABT7SGN3_9CELL|nr:dihydropteroate synthase [Cellulomonas alba]MDM7855358.1 dihydropteroate synthase [Cellulomonas alba]
MSVEGPAGLPPELRRAGRCLVMGVVNVTPDSFSDGGRWFTPSAAVAHALALVEDGADLLDVGGESTRPGARRVPVEEERARVIPVIADLARRGLAVSVDTTRAQIAREAVDAGAVLVNDVSGGLADDAMYGVVAQTGAAYVAMHWRGHADVMDDLDRYDDVVADVRRELAERVADLRAAGVRDDQVVLDPGLGFAKPGASNWPLLARLPELVADGFPVLVGASRKRFLGHLLAGPTHEPAPPLRRDDATAAITALAAVAGAWAVRVHEVSASVDAVKVAAAWTAAATRDGGAQDDDELAVDEDARTGGSTR